MKPIATILLCLWAGLAAAHHEPEGRMRVILVEEQGPNTVIYLRLPAPLLFAAESMARSGPFDRVDAPFLRAEARQDVWIHRLDRPAIAADPEAFAARIAATLPVTLDGAETTPSVIDFAVHAADALPPFDTPGDARASLAAAMAGEDPFIGTAFVDAMLRIDGQGRLTIDSALTETAVPPEIYIESVVVDYRTDPARRIVRLGELDRAFTLGGR